ncbi:hypothetical protein [Paenibacillus campinasensis]|uniref:Uncharacterized protein n=1 Tax=Paenibacillus campinasensis TaxID=66347 RepID=A0A268ELB6_9BACL|nr:hypothetical protein [Paenibacillus campinasensis]PAD73906.1 hypothetical protein CHH67_18910 [Paenibacillus campinasensis]
MNFRDQLLKDVERTFMNPKEFAEIHTVTTFSNDETQVGRRDRELEMIIEKFTLDGRPIQTADGVSAHNLIIHIDPEILAYTPRVDQNFYLDFTRYTVMDVSNDTGVLKIVLQSNGSRP